MNHHAANEMVKNLFNQIDKEVKDFVRQICADTNLDEEKVYYKTNFEHMMYVIRLYHTEYKQQVCYSIPIDEFLIACQQQKLEDLLNHKVREMLMMFGQSKEEVIYI